MYLCVCVRTCVYVYASEISVDETLQLWQILNAINYGMEKVWYLNNNLINILRIPLHVSIYVSVDI